MTPEEQFANELKNLVGDEEFAAMQNEAVDDPTAEKEPVAEEEESTEDSTPTPQVTTQPPEAAETDEEGEEDLQTPTARVAYQLREEKRLRHEAEQRAAAAAERDAQRDAQVREILERFASMQQAQQAPANDEPEFEDPEVQKLLDALSRRQSQELAPIKERFETEQQQQEYERQVEQYRQQQAQQVESFVQEIDAAEREYAASREGKGYYDRFEKFKEYQRGIHKAALGRFGANDEFVERATSADLMGLMSYARNQSRVTGASPAEIVDAYIQATIPGAAAEEAPKTPPKPAAQKKPSSALAAAVRANAEGASPPQGATPAAPSGPVTTDLVLEVGVDRALTPALLDKWAAEGNLVDNALRLLTD